MKYFKSRFNLIVTVIVLVAVITGAVLYSRNSASAAEDGTPTVQTAKVRRGDMVITASGAGVVEPAAQVDLAFRSAGVLYELNIQLGDQVVSDEVLARLEENIQAEADFQALFSKAGVANARFALADAQAELDNATNAYAYVLGDEAWYWESQLEDAEAALNAFDAAATQSQRDEAQNRVDDARSRRDYLLSLRTDISELDMSLVLANREAAKVKLLDAQTALEVVLTDPSSFTSPLAVLGPQTAKLEQARLAVENTRLTAPFNGTVTELKVVTGQTVNTTPVITIAKTDELFAHIYLDESDLDKIAKGKLVTITFDAYPDTSVVGEVILVEPALQSVDGSPVVSAWVALPVDSGLAILPGMNLEAEVIAAESKDTLLLPKQALRELEPGQYAVFLVGVDGTLILTPVQVGLIDYANAEILSGLNIGDVVSTGNVETK